MAKKKKQTEQPVIEKQEEKKEELKQEELEQEEKKEELKQEELKQEETKEEQQEEQQEELDAKTKILLEFKNFMETTVKSTYRTSADNGYRILEYYNKYTGRQERWTGCASCISGKFQYMIGECKRKNISINI